MQLEEYIKELLYRYDCVIVPEFGAFISNTKSATIKDDNFTPPYNKVTFNSLIQNNDGLLANHIAQADRMPYETAVNFIRFETEAWIDKLLDDVLTIEGIGEFYLVNDKIHFEADTTVNYLTSSFGLSTFISKKVERHANAHTVLDANNNRIVYKTEEEEISPKVIPLVDTTKEEVIVLEAESKSNGYLKYVAILLIGFSIVGLLAKKSYDDRMEMKHLTKIVEQQKIRESKIQTATFSIVTPLPTITINTRAAVEIKKYHIISGAFRSVKNAQKSVNQLKTKGFEASIVGKNKWDLTQVSCQSFTTLEKANKALFLIKRNINKEAWVLVSK